MTMNKYISKFVLMSAFAVAGTLSMTSCTDYLDKAPGNRLRSERPLQEFYEFPRFCRGTIQLCSCGIQ